MAHSLAVAARQNVAVIALLLEYSLFLYFSPYMRLLYLSIPSSSSFRYSANFRPFANSAIYGRTTPEKSPRIVILDSSRDKRIPSFVFGPELRAAARNLF